MLELDDVEAGAAAETDRSIDEVVLTLRRTRAIEFSDFDVLADMRRFCPAAADHLTARLSGQWRRAVIRTALRDARAQAPALSKDDATSWEAASKAGDDAKLRDLADLWFPAWRQRPAALWRNEMWNASAELHRERYGREDNDVELLSEVADNFLALNSFREAGTSWLEIGLKHLAAGKFDEAIAAQSGAKALFERISTTGDHVDLYARHCGASHAEYNLGVVYLEQNRLDVAEASFLSARDGYAGIGRVASLAATVHKLAIVYHRTSRLSEASDAYLQARHHYVEVGSAYEAAAVLERAAQTMMERDAFDTAAPAFEKAHQEFAAIGSKADAAHCVDRIATALWFEKRYADAAEAYRRAFAEFSALDDKARSASASFKLALALENSNRAEEAVLAYNTALDLRTSSGATELAAEAAHAMGLALFGLGRQAESVAAFDLALASFERLEVRDDRVARATFSRAVSLEALGRHSEATSAYTEASGLFGEVEATHRTVACCRYNLALGLDKSGQSAKAESVMIDARCLFEGLSLEEDVADCNYMLAGLFSRAGRLVESAQAYEDAREIFDQIGLYGRAADCEFGLGSAFYLHKRHADAEVAYTRARSSFERLSFRTNNAAGCLMGLANTLADQGRMAESVNLYRRASEEYAALGDDTTTADCQYRAATRLVELGDLDGAEVAYQIARENYQHVGNELAVADCDFGLGNTFHLTKRYADAEGAYTQARSSFERLSFRTNNAAGCLMGLANTLADQGRMAESVNLYRRASEEYAALGDDTTTADCQYRAATRLVELGDLDGAEVAYQIARENYQQVGNEHAVADCDFGLGNTFHLTKRYADAEGAYTQARSSFERLSFRTNNAAGCLMGLANTLADQGRMAESVNLYRRASEEYAALGDDTTAASCTHNAASRFEQLGHHEDAEAAYRDARACYERLDDQERIGDCDLGLGNTFYAADRYADAESAYNRARAVYLTLSELPENAAGCLVNLGNALSRQDRHSEAAHAYREASTEYTRFDSTATAAHCAYSAGCASRAANQLTEAEWWLARALDAFAELDGDEPLVAYIRTELGYVYTATGQHARAVDQHVDAASRFEQNDDGEQAAYSLLQAAMSYEALEQWADAVGACEQARDRHETLKVLAGQAVCHRHLARLYQLEHRWADSMNAGSHGEQIYLQLGDGRAAATCRTAIAYAQVALGEADAAYASASEAWGRVVQLRAQREHSDGLHALLYTSLITEHLDDAVSAFDAVSEDVAEFGTSLRSGIAGLLFQIATRYRQQSRYLEAEAVFESAAALWSACGEVKDATMCGLNIGEICYKTGQYSLAAHRYQIVLDISIELGEPIQVADCHRQLSAVYVETGRYQDAEAALRTARVVYEEFIRDSSPEQVRTTVVSGRNWTAWTAIEAAAECYEKIGMLCLQTGRSQDAELYFSLARDEFLDARSLGAAATCWHHLGSLYMAAQGFEAAERAFLETKTLCAQIDDKFMTLMSNLYLARVYLLTRQYSGAANALESAEGVLRTMNPSPWELAYCSYCLASAYKDAGELEKADERCAGAREQYATSGHHLDVADCDVLAARILLTRYNRDYNSEIQRVRFVVRAIRLALPAVIYMDCQRFQFSQANARAAWANKNAQLFAEIFSWADQVDDQTLIAELVEASVNSGVHTAEIAPAEVPSPLKILDPQRDSSSMKMTASIEEMNEPSDVNAVEGPAGTLGGLSRLIAGAKLPLGAPPRLLLGPGSEVLYPFLDDVDERYTSIDRPAGPIHTW